MSNKILYLSAHSILEFDEVKLLSELGYEIFSPGSFIEPANPGDASLRPGIPNLIYDPDIVEQWHRLAAKHPGEDTKNHLTKEFVDLFDTVIVMHLPRWIERNWEAMKHKRVIWRTIGQSISQVEAFIKPYRTAGLQIIRYSPMERNIPSYAGEDTLIRFYKDPDEYKDWNGRKLQVITFGQSMRQRNQACNFDYFEQTTRIFPRKLFGPGNENAREIDPNIWGGKLTHIEQIKELQDNRVYFYTGTHPASYTLNFMEAFMTGMPIVALGPIRGNASYFPHHNLYEIPNIIQNYYNGFITDNMNEARIYISQLLGNQELTQLISINARKTAIGLFGKDFIKQLWKDFLGD